MDDGDIMGINEWGIMLLSRNDVTVSTRIAIDGEKSPFMGSAPAPRTTLNHTIIIKLIHRAPIHLLTIRTATVKPGIFVV